VGAVVIFSCAVLPAFFAEAQATRTPRIGYLGNGNPTTGSPQLEAFRGGLRELGWIEDQTVTIEYRWAEGNPDRLPALLAELVQIKVNVIVLAGTASIRAAKEATSAIPIVFVRRLEESWARRLLFPLP